MAYLDFFSVARAWSPNVGKPSFWGYIFVLLLTPIMVFWTLFLLGFGFFWAGAVMGFLYGRMLYLDVDKSYEKFLAAIKKIRGSNET